MKRVARFQMWPSNDNEAFFFFSLKKTPKKAGSRLACSPGWLPRWDGVIGSARVCGHNPGASPPCTDSLCLPGFNCNPLDRDYTGHVSAEQATVHSSCRSPVLPPLLLLQHAFSHRIVRTCRTALSLPCFRSVPPYFKSIFCFPQLQGLKNTQI